MRKDRKKTPKETTVTEESKPFEDGMNTPVPDRAATPVLSASEAALYKQAKNPLGDPHKI